MKGKVGRPRKYGEDRTVFLGVSVPEGLFNKLELYSYEKGISRSEAVVLLLASASPEIAESLRKQIREYKEILKQMKRSAKEIAEMIDKIERRSEGELLWKPYDTPQEIREIVSENIEKIKEAVKGKEEWQVNTVIEVWTEKLYTKIIRQKAKKGYIPKNEKLLRKIIFQEIMRQVEE